MKKAKSSAALIIIGAVMVSTAIKLLRDEHTVLQEKRDNEIKYLIFAIKSVLDDVDVCDFDKFSETLDEYYNIQSCITENGEVQYFCDDFKKMISSKDIKLSRFYDTYSYDIYDLKMMFMKNQKFL